jgi:hypothetical protein
MCPIYLLPLFYSHQWYNIFVVKIYIFSFLINDKYNGKISNRVWQTHTICIPLIYILFLDKMLCLRYRTKHWWIKTQNGKNGGKPYMRLWKTQDNLEITCANEEAYLNELVVYQL